jgi:hypothetical protein
VRVGMEGGREREGKGRNARTPVGVAVPKEGSSTQSRASVPPSCACVRAPRRERLSAHTHTHTHTQSHRRTVTNSLRMRSRGRPRMISVRTRRGPSVSRPRRHGRGAQANQTVRSAPCRWQRAGMGTTGAEGCAGRGYRSPTTHKTHTHRARQDELAHLGHAASSFFTWLRMTERGWDASRVPSLETLKVDAAPTVLAPLGVAPRSGDSSS